MPYLLLLILLLAVIFWPQYRVKSILARHHREELDFPGNAAELARHLLDRFDLQHVKVERTALGDHYDPQTQSVRLTDDKFEARTLTAITVAAHECGHALQHAAREPLFMLRTRLASSAVMASRIGSFLLFAAPFMGMLTRAPSITLINLLGAFLILGFSLLVSLLTLPVELDASYKKALPLLESGYVEAKHMPAARQILSAAAWTYVAAALANLLNFWRWLAVLRR